MMKLNQQIDDWLRKNLAISQPVKRRIISQGLQVMSQGSISQGSISQEAMSRILEQSMSQGSISQEAISRILEQSMSQEAMSRTLELLRSEALEQKRSKELKQFWASVHQAKKGLARFEELAEEGVKLTAFLPEDLQAILEDMQKRWIKKQYSAQKTRYLTLLYLFDMLLGYVKSQIANIWLPKSSSTKEIE